MGDCSRMTPERGCEMWNRCVWALLGAWRIDRIGDAEEAPLIADPDPDLTAIGILGDLRVDVGRDHQDSYNLGRVIRDRPVALRATRQREHVAFVQLTGAFRRPIVGRPRRTIRSSSLA